MKFEGNGETARLIIRAFDRDEKDFERFLKNSFKKIREAGCPNLLIDLRDNPGGNLAAIDRLAGFIADSPFVVIPEVELRVSSQAKKEFKKRIPSFLRWLPVQNLDSRGKTIWGTAEGSNVRIKDEDKFRLQKERYPGTIYVLINERTYSSASLLAGLVKEFRWGTLIGRETGYPSSGSYAEPLYFKLSTIGLIGRVLTMKIMRDINAPISDHGVLPDYAVDIPLEDKLKDWDTILEFTLNLIQKCI